MNTMNRKLINDIKKLIVGTAYYFEYNKNKGYYFARLELNDIKIIFNEWMNEEDLEDILNTITNYLVRELDCSTIENYDFND